MAENKVPHLAKLFYRWGKLWGTLEHKDYYFACNINVLYGNRGGHPLRQDPILGPLTPYQKRLFSALFEFFW